MVQDLQVIMGAGGRTDFQTEFGGSHSAAGTVHYLPKTGEVRKLLKGIVEEGVTFSSDGFVRLVDFMGGDDAVVQAARVSLAQGTDTEEKDRKLISFLYKNRHETPFEHSVFKFHVSCPILVARWWLSWPWASYNEISGRYTEKIVSSFHIPEGLGDDEKEMRDIVERSVGRYRELLERGVAKEQARGVLPSSFFVQFYVTINARSLFRFFHYFQSVKELSPYLEKMDLLVREKMPWTHAAVKAHGFPRAIKHPEFQGHFKWGRKAERLLDHGRIQLVDSFGSDREIAESVAVSPSSNFLSLLRRGLRDNSLHPAFEKGVLKIRVKCPIYVYREWYRHRWASYADYHEYVDTFYVPKRFRTQKAKNYGFVDFPEKENLEVTRLYLRSLSANIKVYRRFLTRQGRPDVAREVLPYCSYVGFTTTVHLQGLMNFLSLRADVHAQYEIRAYAERIAVMFAEKFPLTFLAFMTEVWKGENERLDGLKEEVGRKYAV